MLWNHDKLCAWIIESTIAVYHFTPIDWTNCYTSVVWAKFHALLWIDINCVTSQYQYCKMLTRCVANRVLSSFVKFCQEVGFLCVVIYWADIWDECNLCNLDANLLCIFLVFTWRHGDHTCSLKRDIVKGSALEGCKAFLPEIFRTYSARIFKNLAFIHFQNAFSSVY